MSLVFECTFVQMNSTTKAVPLSISYDTITLRKFRIWIHIQAVIYSLKHFGEWHTIINYKSLDNQILRFNIAFHINHKDVFLLYLTGFSEQNLDEIKAVLVESGLHVLALSILVPAFHVKMLIFINLFIMCISYQ